MADTYNYRIQKYNSSGAYVSTLGVTGVGDSDNGHFYYTMGVAVDSSGNVYVADYNNQRIQKYNSSGVYVSTLGVTGVWGTDNSHFRYPSGVAVDGSGNVYVADTDNNRIQKFVLVETLTIAGTASNSTGTITGGSSINCSVAANGTISGTRSETGNYGTSVTLTASPAAGSYVTWSGCTTSADNTCNVTLTADTTVTASFTLNTYIVTATATGNGTGAVSSNAGGISYSYPVNNTGTTSLISYGTNVTLTATADTGSTVSWTACSGNASGNGTALATCSYSALDGSKTAQATFTLKQYADS